MRDLSLACVELCPVPGPFPDLARLQPNRCLMEEHLGAAHIAGDLIQPFVNPRGLAVAAALFIIGLPLCVRSSSSFSISPASYTTAKLSALHFLFRMSYSQVRGELLSCPSECRRVMRIQIRMPHSQVLDVMLYTVFRQRRPCTCSWDGGAFAQVGSTYGSNDVRGVCKRPCGP